MEYIVEKALVLIPALFVLGKIIKSIEKIPNKFIPLILLVFGVSGTLLLLGPSVDAAIQGVLVTGVTVYGHQVFKQLTQEE
ncbi:MAG: phage holin family protein [Oscillospiraceae bacterium]|nr:phage holin family protein [Oscillospiraceae bacterium]